jgi:hypothetical protein
VGIIFLMVGIGVIGLNTLGGTEVGVIVGDGVVVGVLVGKGVGDTTFLTFADLMLVKKDNDTPISKNVVMRSTLFGDD